MKPIRFILFLMMVSSCGGEKGGYHGGFAEEVQLAAWPQDFDSVALKYPFRVKVEGASMYVTDIHPETYFCHEFEYPSMKYRKSFARKGKGPEELLDTENIIVMPDQSVYLLDAYGKKVYVYNHDREQIETETELPEELNRCLDFTLYNDSVYIIPDYTGKHRLSFVNRRGEIVRQMGNIPVKYRSGNIPEAALGQAWRSFVHYNPGNGILAMATQLGEVIEIYDLTNNQVKVVTGLSGEPKCIYKEGAAYPDGIMGYSDVFVGKQLIYAVFGGQEFEKINKGEVLEHGGNTIHVFDLEGKPVRKYLIDRHITGFHLIEDESVIIGLDVNNEQIVKFII